MTKKNTMTMPTLNERPRMTGVLGWIERIGNKIPHPIYMFIAFFFITLALSAVLSAVGFSAVNPVDNQAVNVVNLLTSESIAAILKNMPAKFTGFGPIGAVFVATLGLGVANGSGFLNSTLRLASDFKSKFLVTMLIVLIGINGNLIGDAAFVVFPPLIAVLYLNLGRNPLAGLFTSYAAVASGFGASLIVGNGDAMLAGMSETAAHLVDESVTVSPASGYYFMLASTILLAPIIAWVSIQFVEKKLDYMGVGHGAVADANFEVQLSGEEKKAMRNACIGLVALVAIIVVMFLPSMPFAWPEGKGFAYSPMLRCIPAVIMFIFAVPGFIYGKTLGKIKTFKDALNMMAEEIKTISSFFLICFFACQFIAVFGDSNIGTIIAIKCGLFLRSTGINGPGLILCFVFVVAIINMFVSSMSAKWAILSTIFVPMLMIAGISPSATQMAYRVGDSLTNNITPTFAYLGIILSYAQRYDEKAQTGTVIAYMLPFSIAFTIAWVGLLLVWMLLNLPIGPGASFFL